MALKLLIYYLFITFTFVLKQISNMYHSLKENILMSHNLLKQNKISISKEKAESVKQMKLQGFANSECEYTLKETKQNMEHELEPLNCDMHQIETAELTNTSKTFNVTRNVRYNQKKEDSVYNDCYKICNKKTNLNRKVQHLSWNLGSLETFSKPNIKLEQYATSAEIAAGALHAAQMYYSDISGKIVADLGCGCGVLTIGVHLLDAELCIGIDICGKALRVCQRNISNFNCNNVELIQNDVISLDNRFYKMFDTVVMNPPFGTKGNKGIDIKFLKQALSLANTAVYSFHKTATRKYIQEISEKWNVKMEPLYQIRFDLPKTYAKHVHAVKDIEVDFLRFSFRNSSGSTSI